MQRYEQEVCRLALASLRAKHGVVHVFSCQAVCQVLWRHRALTLPQLVEHAAANEATSGLTEHMVILTVATGLQHGFLAAVAASAPVEAKKPKPHSTKFEVPAMPRACSP